MTKSFFITGTGTDIGKSFITCALIYQLKKLGYNIGAIKPIISGWRKDQQNDTKDIIDSLGYEYNMDNIDKISPWRYKEALAPSMAAKINNQIINYSEVRNFCKSSIKNQDFFFCEGAGGIMVPIDNNKTTLDLMKELDIEIILVCGSYLGTISHTLSAIRSLEQASVKIKSIIINESLLSVGLDDIIYEIKPFINYPIYKLRRINHITDNPWQHADNIVQSLF